MLDVLLKPSRGTKRIVSLEIQFFDFLSLQQGSNWKYYVVRRTRPGASTLFMYLSIGLFTDVFICANLSSSSTMPFNSVSVLEYDAQAYTFFFLKTATLQGIRILGALQLGKSRVLHPFYREYLR
jgi:hypothetical protein